MTNHHMWCEECGEPLSPSEEPDTPDGERICRQCADGLPLCDECGDVLTPEGEADTGYDERICRECHFGGSKS